ncbi:MAG: ABC transporter permease, partial [Candidatus Caldarchaeum sp.]
MTRNSYRSYMGVRGALVARAGPDARYTLYGIPLATCTYEWLRQPIKIWAYVVDQEGNITFTLDARQEYTFPTKFLMTTASREAPLILFECVPLEIHGLVDPHLYTSYKYATVLDAYNNGEPRRYALDIPDKPTLPETQAEDSAILFIIPGTRVKFLAGMTPGENRAILTNSTPENEEGEGYEISSAHKVFKHPALSIARDMWGVNEARRQRLGKFRITFSSVEKLQNSAAQEIAKAESAIKNLQYTEAESHARAAWGYALRAHPILLQNTKEILYGLLFYLALTLPFSFFLSRLLTSAQPLVYQILYATACFILVFFTLRWLHPAFKITGNTFVIFVAFAMGSLSLIVMTFVTGKFEMSLFKMQRAADGTQRQPIGKMGIALTALQLALANMRRRKARTILTSVTLVLLTYALLSFTSVVLEIRLNQRHASGNPRYPGILLRNPNLSPLEENTFRSLRAEFPSAPIGRRAWFYGAQQGAQSVLSVSGTRGKVVISAILGLDHEEMHLTRLNETLLSKGRWFQKGDVYTAILPQSIAERLGISQEDVGKIHIRFGGAPFLVIGIAEDSMLKTIHDLDGENILPADFGISRELQMRGQGGDVAFRKYIRLDPSMVMIIPAETALKMNADLRSLSVGFHSFEEATQTMQRVIPRLGLNLYAGVSVNGKPSIQRYSAVPASRAHGLEYILLPVLLSALIILNTMGASVVERTKEIGTLSAIGLAPKHISALFFAEAVIYAVLGAVGGYILAQVGTKIFAAMGIFQGISLNYSSATSLLSCALMFAVVLGSTLYPAKLASRIASPGAEGEWFSNPPSEDLWLVFLPFTVARRQAYALTNFYHDWFEGHLGYALADFVTEDIIKPKDTDDPNALFIQARCWLAPYDLGVQQTVRLSFSPTDVPDTFRVTMQITRESGDPEHWVNLNHRFLENVRKQFLYWRAHGKQEKDTTSE